MDIRPVSPNMRPSTQPVPGSRPRPPQTPLTYSSTPSTPPAVPQQPTQKPLVASQPPASTSTAQSQSQSIYPTPAERPFQEAGPATAGTGAGTSSTDVPKLGLFGSIPTGVVVIAALTVVGGVATFLTPSSTGASGIATFVLLINVLLAFGLFSLNNVARIIFIVFSSLAIASSGLRLFSLIDLQNNLSKQRAAYTQELNELRSKPQTDQQEQAIAKLNLEIKKQEGLTSSAFVRAYMIVGLQLVGSSAMVVYLLRPSVKDRFE